MMRFKFYLMAGIILSWFSLCSGVDLELNDTFTSTIPENLPPIGLETTFGTPALPPIPASTEEPQQLLPEVQRFIEEFQEQNAKFIDALIDPNLQLPYDAIFVRGDGKIEYQGGATTATEIGFWLDYLTLVAKGDIKVSNLSPEEALARLEVALQNVRKLQQDKDKNWNGLLFKYNFKTGAIDRMACIYDNGNFAASLATVIGAFIDETDPDKKDIANLAQEILNAMKPGFQALYNRRAGLMWGNYRKDHYMNILGSEGRLGILMAIVAGDVDPEVWFNLQDGVRRYKLSNGQTAEFLAPYEGAFQLYFPLMFVPEDELSQGFAITHNNYAAVQIDYANKTNLPALRSACASPYQRYRYTYAPGIGVPGTSKARISRDDIGATHGIAFLNLIDPEKAMKMFQKLEEFTNREIWGPYGMFDSVGKHGEVSRVYISLDHLAMLIAMAGKQNQEYFMNYLKHAGKLDLVKSLYAQADIPVTEKVELPEVKEQFIPEAPEVKVPQGRFTLIDFESGRTSDFVSGLGRFDGPGRSDYIKEEVSNGQLVVRYRTTEYNGVWIDLTGLQSLDNYSKLILDLKASNGLRSLKIEIKGNKGGWMHYYVYNIPRDWKTFEIPIGRFEVASWEKRFSRGEIPVQLVITLEGSRLSYSQKEGILYIDNIMLETKE
jgi:hypothetical protein